MTSRERAIPADVPAGPPPAPAPATTPPADARVSDRRTPGEADAGVFCIHFSSDGREHSMWFIDVPDKPGHPPRGLTAEWRVAPDGVLRGEAVRGGRDVLCDGLLLTESTSDADSEGAREAFKRDRDLLRRHGVPQDQAALLAGMRQRPLLATFARRGDLPPVMVRGVHRMLIEAASEYRSACR